MRSSHVTTAVAPVDSAVPVPDFRPGGSFTVGVEEELLLVDDAGGLMGAGVADAVDALRGPAPGGGLVTGEIYIDQVELNTPVCASAEDVRHALRRMRAHVIGGGVRPMAVGLHPTGPLGEAPTVPSPRYDAIVHEYAGLMRTPTAALQVHVGVPDTETAMLVYRGLRHRLPLLRALAATSPYWHGVDSGTASTRSAVIRSYPRTTVPPVLRTWDEYVERLSAIVAAAEVPDHTWVWWDMRPRPLLGTLEVRVMDAQPSLARAAGLTALVQGMARWAVEQPDAVDLSDEVLALNDHRAATHGLEARVVDVDGTPRPLREVAARGLAEARQALGPDGSPLDAVEHMLSGTAEPDRQRRLVADDGMPALLDDLVTRTTDLEA